LVANARLVGTNEVRAADKCWMTHRLWPRACLGTVDQDFSIALAETNEEVRAATDLWVTRRFWPRARLGNHKLGRTV
jgi:hypothetical protein